VIAEVTEVAGPAGTAAVVRLAGPLTFDTAPRARTSLLKAVACQPMVVVADVAELEVPDDLALTLFPAVARHAAAWPGIPLVLAAPGQRLRAALNRMAVTRDVPVAATVTAACAAVDRTPPRRVAQSVAGGPETVSTARATVRAACVRWGRLAVSETAELIMCELASNAVRHAGGVIEISVSLRRRHLHLAVRDRSFDEARIGYNDGRGLLLVDAMAIGWGSTPLPDGKVVWATLQGGPRRM
jgi:hypothetical protein